MDIGSDSKTTAAERTIAILIEAGVDTFFGIPGGPVVSLFNAVLKSKRARLIESRQETSAVFQAIGYYKATGKVPVVLVTAGPGITNAVTGVASAYLDRIPMLIITGEVASAKDGGLYVQSLGHEGINIDEMFRSITCKSVRVQQGKSAVGQVMEAYRAAHSVVRPGPALVIFPINIGFDEASDFRLHTPPPAAVNKSGSPMDPSILADVVDRLSKAKKPLLVLGAGARKYSDQLLALIDLLHIPFVTTPQAKGLIPETHPMSLRHCGLAASCWARLYTRDMKIDFCLVLGTDLDDVTIGSTPLIEPNSGYLVHVDSNSSCFNRNVKTSLGVQCDVGVFVDHLTEAIRFENRKSGLLKSDLRSFGLEDLKRQSAFDVSDFAEDSSPTVAPHRLVADLQKAVGPNATYFSDIGEHMLFALHYLTVRDGDSFHLQINFGSMGSGIASAIGYAIGNPKAKVVCICGDGGMQMAGFELLVAAQLKLNILFVVMNDARYNMVYHGYRQIFGEAQPWETPWVDFVKWGASMGIEGSRIERPGQLTSSFLSDLKWPGDRPLVLDVRQDRNVRIKGAGRVESLQQMSIRHS